MFVAKLRSDSEPDDQQRHVTVLLKTFDQQEANSLAEDLTKRLNAAPGSKRYWVFSVAETNPGWAIERGDLDYVVNGILERF